MNSLVLKIRRSEKINERILKERERERLSPPFASLSPPEHLQQTLLEKLSLLVLGKVPINIQRAHKWGQVEGKFKGDGD